MNTSTVQLEPAVSEIVGAWRDLTQPRALLVGISGIDGSGKGFVALELDRKLRARGLRAAVVSVDPWLTLPRVRLGPPPGTDPGEHFYRNAVRFEALFEQLVLPLRASRSVRVTADTVTESAASYARTTFEFRDADVILLEGVFLFKSSLRSLFDRRVWVDCGEETAMARAVARAQEGLSPEQTREAYGRVYFPAQRVHERLDRPRESAHVIVRNDDRLAAVVPMGPVRFVTDWSLAC